MYLLVPEKSIFSDLRNCYPSIIECDKKEFLRFVRLDMHHVIRPAEVSELAGMFLINARSVPCYLHTTMLRLPVNTIRPLFNSTLLRSSLKRAPTSNSRLFSNGLVQCVRRETFKFQISLPRGSRTIMTERPIVQEANNFSWKKTIVTAVRGVQYLTFQLF
jgi:hypothetical protein